MNNGVIADKPIIINSDPTVKEVAIKIHRSFYEKFDYATVIREGARQEKKRVGLEYHLKDEDIIEIQTI